jgi:PhnB protein
MEQQTLTAYPVVLDVPALNVFLAEVFNATEKLRTIGSAGGFHTEVRIGDTELMIGGGGGGVAWKGEARPMAFHIYVPDTDAVYRRAVDRGAQSLQVPTEQHWGERTANVKDPAGNMWYIATFHGENYFSEGAPTVQPFLQPAKAGPVIDFLVRAFCAAELGRAVSPEGAILHTTLKLGNSAMELIDAQGIYQPMPGMFVLHVPDVKIAHAHAIECGAEAISPTSVKDVAGNLWYLV